MPYRKHNTRRGGNSFTKGNGSWIRNQLAKRPLPVWILVVTDVLILGISLLVFAYFHHVMPRQQEAVGIVSQRVSSGNTYSTNNNINSAQTAEVSQEPYAEPSIEPSSEPSVEPIADNTSEPVATTIPEVTAEPVSEAAAADPVGYFGNKFADKFTDGSIERDGGSYKSGTLNIDLEFYDIDGVQFYVADIYVKDISCFQTVFGEDKYGRGYTESVTSMSKRTGALIAVNGDYYGARSDGVVIRNGVLYRDENYPDRDICVLFWDGTMKCYNAGAFDAESVMEQGAYQAWNFGLALLDENGQPKEKFNSDVVKANPRTVLGYYEPGHYCLVVVDGRSDESAGLTMSKLSKLMYNLGCVQAYNLDGGQSSVMATEGKMINNAYNGGRKNSDAIIIVEGPDW